MLEVPYFKQDTVYNCGPASVQMILAYHNIKAAEADLAAEMKTNDEYGTHHANIIEKLQQESLYCYVNSNSSLDEIRYYIDTHQLPVLVHYIEPTDNEGHYSLVIGFKGDSIVLHDPFNGPHLEIEIDVFLDRWRDEAGHFVRWILVSSKEPFSVGRQYCAY